MMRLDLFSVIVFDLDDTLYLERDYVKSGFDAVGDWLQSELEWPARDTHRFSQICCRLFHTGHRGDIFDRALKKENLPAKKPTISDLVECYRVHAPKIQLLPDALQILQLLHGFRQIWVLTDGPHVSQQRKVAALQLHRWTDQVIYTDEWGRPFWKPSPDAFRHVQDSSGAKPSQCIYIADNPVKDFVGPNRLGWATLRVRRQNGLHTQIDNDPSHAPNAEVRDLFGYCQQLTREDQS